MRINKLRIIRNLLEKEVEKKGYFIYIAPLNSVHYKRYIEIINSDFETLDGYRKILTDENNLFNSSKKIDENTDILVDSELFVSSNDSSELNLNYKLIDFLIENRILYKNLIPDNELIKEFENTPKDIFLDLEQ